jgi:hypothetical protein
MPIKPCLGYPSRTSAAVGLAAKGFSTREIAARINAETPDDPVTPTKVSRLLSAARHERVGSAPLQVSLSPAGFQRLRAEAEARGSRSDYLARRLIEAALADNLIDAILDDGGDA